MEISQGNSLCLPVSQKSKTVIFFSFYKIGEQEGGTGPMGKGRVDTSGREKMAGKGGRRVNMMQKMCTHVGKCKNDTC
jgi:hypothetical protein